MHRNTHIPVLSSTSQVQSTWANATFDLKAHREKRDVLLLGGLDDLTTRVDDSVGTMGNVLASPHVGPIRSEAEEFAEKLSRLQVNLCEGYGENPSELSLCVCSCAKCFCARELFV